MAEAQSNLNPILQAAAKAEDSALATRAAINSNIAAAAPLEKVIQESAASMSLEDQIAGLMADKAALQTQVKNFESFEALGGHEAQAVLGKNLVEDQAKLKRLEDVRADIIDDTPTGIGLFDQIINGFRTVQVDAEIKGAKSEVDTSAAVIQQVTQSQESFAKVNSTHQKNTSEALIASKDRKRVALAAGSAAETSLKTLEANSDRLLQVQQMDRNAVSTLIQLRQLENQAVEADYRSEQRGLLAGRLEDQSVAVNRALAAKGQPAMSQEQVQFGLDREPERFNILMRQGAGDRVINGGTPAQSLNSDKITDPEQQYIAPKNLEFLREVERKAHAGFVSTTDSKGNVVPNRNPPKNQGEIDTAVNLAVEAEVVRRAGNIIQGDQSNIFAAPPLTVLNDSRLVTDTKFHQVVMKDSGASEFNTQALYDAGMSAVAAGSISMEELATGIDAYHTAAVNYNNELDGGFIRQAMSNQMTYNTSVKVPATGFSQLLIASKFSPIEERGGTIQRKTSVSELFDQMDYSKVLEVITKMRAAQPRQDNVSNITPDTGDTQ